VDELSLLGVELEAPSRGLSFDLLVYYLENFDVLGCISAIGQDFRIVGKAYQARPLDLYRFI
jgi:hypothetical protein